VSSGFLSPVRQVRESGGLREEGFPLALSSNTKEGVAEDLPSSLRPQCEVVLTASRDMRHPEVDLSQPGPYPDKSSTSGVGGESDRRTRRRRHDRQSPQRRSAGSRFSRCMHEHGAGGLRAATCAGWSHQASDRGGLIRPSRPHGLHSFGEMAGYPEPAHEPARQARSPPGRRRSRARRPLCHSQRRPSPGRTSLRTPTRSSSMSQ